MPASSAVRYFRAASVTTAATGFHVAGAAADLTVSWGTYATEVDAHTAARTLDRLLSEYERLDNDHWKAAKKRLWAWEAEVAKVRWARQARELVEVSPC